MSDSRKNRNKLFPMRIHKSNCLLLVMSGKLLPVLTFMLLIFTKSYSQAPAKKETLEFLNTTLGNNPQVEIKTGHLVLVFINENGKIFREDKVPLEELDVKAYFEKESGLVCVPCLKNADGCVTKTMIEQKIKRPADRISMKVKSEEQAASVMKALEHLIKLTTEIGYKDEISFE